VVDQPDLGYDHQAWYIAAPLAANVLQDGADRFTNAIYILEKTDQNDQAITKVLTKDFVNGSTALGCAGSAASSGLEAPRAAQSAIGSPPAAYFVGAVSEAGSGAAERPVHRFMPAIMANSAGAVAVVFHESSAKHPISLRVAGRRTTDDAGTMCDPVEIKVGTPVFPSSSNRWGDYTGIVHAEGSRQFWGIGEYVNDNDTPSELTDNFRASWIFPFSVVESGS